MPMVSAAGYPTQDTPTVSPSPTPGADYQSISAATPNAFGAQVGVAQERLGNAFEQAGTGLAQAAVERQQLTNSIAVGQASNHALDSAQTILSDYTTKRGIDAVNGQKDAASSLDKMINDTRATLTNPRQLVEFDRETMRLRSYWQGSIRAHYDKELTQSAINTAHASYGLAGQGLAATAANQDVEGFSLSVEKMMKARQDEGKVLGWTQPQYDEAFGQVRATATSMWTENLALKDPVAAKEFLEHNKDALSGKGDEYVRLSKLVKDHHDAAVADKFVSGMQGRGGGLVRGGAIQGEISDSTNWEIEHNNFAGIRKPGVIATPHQGGFKDYATPEEGIADLQRLLKVYQDRHGLHTLSGIINRWAPPSENPTEALIKRAEQVTGFKRDDNIDLNDATTMAKVTEAMIRNEQGGKLPRKAAEILQGGAPDTAVPTQTGVQAIPAAAAVPALETRSGLPPLDQQFDEIDKSNLTDDQKRIAKDNATKRTSALEMAAQRAERLRVEHERVQVQAAADEVAKDVYSPNPKITPAMIANDPRLSSNFAMRDHLIRFVNDPPGSSVPTHQSNALAMSLIERMQPNYNKPDKITSIEQIMEQTRGLNRSDWTFVNNQFHAQQQLGGETIRQQRAELLANYKGQIVGLINDPHINPEGFARLYRYEHFVQSRVDEYQKAGKNSQELFDPKSPNFLANPETLKSFGPTANDLTKAQGNVAADLTKIPYNDLAAGVTQGKYRRDLVVLEVERRLRAGEMQNPQVVPIR